MISIVTVNWNSYDFAELLVDSIQWFSRIPNEIIMVDNSEVIKPLSGVIQLPQNTNIGHGAGLNIGAQAAKYPYTMFLDIDCHIVDHHWEEAFLSKMKIYDVIGGRGVPAKPIRPACMFMKSVIAKSYDWESTPGYQGHRITPEGYDVAIKAFHEMCDEQILVGLLEAIPSRYDTLNGEEWCVDGKPFVYHHWHGTSTHLPCRQADFPGKDLQADKQSLFDRYSMRFMM